MDVERPIDRYKTVDIDPGRFAAAREEAGHTQSSLARAAQLSQALVNSVERGRKSPSLVSARKLARALNVSLDDIRADGSTA